MPAPTELAAHTVPTTETAELAQEEDDSPAVPFPPSQNLETSETVEPLVLERPPSVFDLYDDITPTEGVAV